MQMRNNIEMNLRETWCEEMGLIYLAQYMILEREQSSSIKGGQLFDHMCDYHLLRTVYDSWS
jgi:hypothetical protein